MNTKTIDWLREGPSWLKYAVDKQLLQENADIQPVLHDSVIIEIIRRLKDRRCGIPALGGSFMDSDRFENPYWDLFFMADLGLTAADLNLQTEIEQFLVTQNQDGTYITEPGMKPSYFCKSGIILAAIARMGYQSDPHIQKVVALLLRSQRLDGGWYCNSNHDIGASLQCEDSCPQENLNNLLLLGNYPEYRSNSRFNGAIDLLLKHWEMRGTGYQIVYFGVGKRYQSLQYPATRYGIIRVLDALSLYPYAMRQSAFRNMLDFVRHKGQAGRYAVETPTPYTSLEPPEQCNRLLTFILTRIEKRVADIDK
jgi:hypothetical protein